MTLYALADSLLICQCRILGLATRMERFSGERRRYVDRDSGNNRQREGSARLFLAPRIGSFSQLVENLDSRAKNTTVQTSGTPNRP